MANINQVKFNTDGWNLEGRSESQITWHNNVPDGLYLNFFPIPPDLSANLDNVSAIRAQYRRDLKQANGGLVSLDVMELSDLQAVKVILKIPIPKQQHGLIYLASYTIPFADFSYVIKVQCQEWGTTGIRDAIIFDQAFGSGQVTIDTQSRKMIGWQPDPSLDMNLAEQEEYDNQFPDNPLSRARQCLAQIQATLAVDTEIINAPKFVGASQKGFFQRFNPFRKK